MQSSYEPKDTANRLIYTPREAPSEVRVRPRARARARLRVGLDLG